MFRIIALLFLLSAPASAQFAIFQRSAGLQFHTQVFNCTSFVTTNTPCGVGGLIAGSGTAWVIQGTQNGNTPAVSGGVATIDPGTPNGHVALSLNYQTLVNVQQFKSTFTFVPNGWNIAFVLNNSNNGTFNGPNFSAGAGCEGGFFQGFQTVSPNNVFAIDLDQYNTLMGGGNPFGTLDFTYSSVQYYQGAFASNAPNPPGQSPCNPNLGGTGFTYAGVDKVSTSPVPLNSPPGTGNTSTLDTYQVTVTYDGSNLTVDLFDVTASGTCTPVTSGTCFHKVWTGVNVPSMAGGNTAYVGLSGGTNANTGLPLNVTQFNYYTP